MADPQATYSQSVRKGIMQKLLAKQQEPDPAPQADPEPEPLPEEKTLMKLFKGVARKEGK